MDVQRECMSWEKVCVQRHATSTGLMMHALLLVQTRKWNKREGKGGRKGKKTPTVRKERRRVRVHTLLERACVRVWMKPEKNPVSVKSAPFFTQMTANYWTVQARARFILFIHFPVPVPTVLFGSATMVGFGANRRGGRLPSFILIGLMVLLALLSYNYWSVSRQHRRALDELAEVHVQVKRTDAARSRLEKRNSELMLQVRALWSFYTTSSTLIKLHEMF